MMDLRRARFLLVPLALAVACGGTAEDSPAGDGDGDGTSGGGDGDGDVPSGDGDGDVATGDGDGDGDGVPAELQEALEGRTFVLESADGYSFVSYTTVSVTFDQGVIDFLADCNRYSAEVTFEEDVLVTEGFSSTLAGCEQELHAQDEWLAAFFSDRPTVRIDGDRVIFTTDDASLVFLDEEAADDPPPLIGTVWDVWALTEGNSASGGFDVVPTVTFTVDGSVIVFSGCNTGAGEFEFDENTITILEGIGYSEASCADAELAGIESHMQAVFIPGELSYSFNGQDLAIERGEVGVRARMRQ